MDKDRPRFSESEARKHLAETKSNAIEHLVDNGDGTFSVMFHIVCETCDYCVEQGDCRGEPNCQAVSYKEEPYEKQNAAQLEWEKEWASENG